MKLPSCDILRDHNGKISSGRVAIALALFTTIYHIVRGPVVTSWPEAVFWMGFWSFSMGKIVFEQFIELALTKKEP